MNLGEVLKAIFKGDQQGQLVIKFADERHLCKISVENGQAVYLSLGHMSPDEALDAIVGKAVEWSNFIKGMPVRKRLDEPITQLLLNIAEAAPPTEVEVPLDAITEAVKAALAEVVIKAAPNEAVAQPAPNEVVVEAATDEVVDGAMTDAARIAEMKRRRMNMIMNRR